jgi:lambda family phage portal protein
MASNGSIGPLTRFERSVHGAIERVIALASPERAVKRQFERKIFEFGYDAANPGRARTTRASGLFNAASENLTNQRDRIKMMWETRDLVQNYSFIKSILLKEAMYVCGKIQYQANTGDPQIDSLIEAYWQQWCENCDITGRHVFRQLIQLCHVAMRRDGDFGFILAAQGPELKLQCVEADRIGNPYQAGMAEENYFGGIKVNDFGQIVSYRIFTRNIHGQYSDPAEVPPDSFVHYFDPLRSDQYRGITAFDTAIPHARDLYELLQMEKLAVKWASSQTGIITKQDPSLPDWKTGDGTTNRGTPLEVVEAGKLHRLLPGESVVPFPAANRPSPTFQGFIMALVREMANGLNLPYSFVWDMSVLGGATARLETAQTQRAFQRHQNLLIEQVLNRIKNAVLTRAIAFKLIPPVATYKLGKWQFPAHITADVGYQTQADLAMLTSGLKTRSDIYGEMGLDFEDQSRVLAREIQFYQRLAGETGVPIELLTQTLPNASLLLAQMQQAQAASAQGQVIPPPPSPNISESETAP